VHEVRLRLQAHRRALRASLWFLPAVAATAGVVLGEAFARVSLVQDGALFGLVFTSSADTARTVLQTIATSLITVTGLTFSTAVVALQVATGQYTPRLLRNFLADRGNQVVLAGLVATFAFSIVLLRRVQSPAPGQDAVVPVVGVTVAIAMALGCVGLLIYFFHHVTTQLRVETVMEDVVTHTLRAIDTVHPERDEDHTPIDLPEPPDGAIAVPVHRSGHVQSVDLDALLGVARDTGLDIRLRPWVGDHVTAGTTLAWAWANDGAATIPVDEGDLAERCHRAIHVGRDRSVESDPAYGMREIVDIAVRAMSPAVNDPTTAVLAVQELTTVLARLGGRHVDDSVRHDDTVHVSLPRPDFTAYVALAQDQIRRAGAREPAVAVALLHCLRDVAETVRAPHLLPALTERADAVVAAVQDAGAADLDLVPVLAAHDHFCRVRDGRADPQEATAD
jgi:uncharacterized membrane protein